DEGRINFKTGDDKLPFAFTGVSGSVEQILPGRWQLQLAAQPWRSGVSLQSAGTMKVLGDVAGTSARLQPAGITLHWSAASLADVLRLFRGEDYGVRGTFALDATAKSGTTKEDLPGDWSFSIQGRSGQIHRWDLAERADNPRLNLKVNGRWNIGSGSLAAEELVVEGPRSNLRGQFRITGGNAHSMEWRLDSLGIQASDLLAWYRAFHPEVVEGATAEQYFTGGMIVRGWPLSLESAALSSSGGVVKVPGLTQPVRIGPLNGGRERGALTIGPVRVALGGEVRDVMAPKGRRVALALKNAADLTFTHELNAAHLDRWVGPRARPSWLQRLLPPLLGGSAPSTPASELVRRVNAEGELDIGQLTIEKLKLEQVQAKGYLHDLQLDVREAQ